MRALAALAFAIALTAAPALAETQTETIVAEQRTSVSVRANPQAVQALLPSGWVPSAAAGAPNISLIFMDRTLQLTPDGKPLNSGANRLLVIAVGARNAATGETRSMIVGGYSTDPAYVPGAYKVNRGGTVTVQRRETSAELAGKPRTDVVEHWQVRGADDAKVDFDLTYQRALPELRTFEQKNYSGADPAFYRIYRGEQAVAPVSLPAARVELKVSGGLLAKVFDGSQQVAGVSVAPFYSRRTFLP